MITEIKEINELKEIAKHTLEDALRKLALLVIDGNVRKPIISKGKKTALIHDIIFDAEEIGKEIGIDEIVKKSGYSVDEVKEILNDLIEMGEIYEPEEGVYKIL